MKQSALAIGLLALAGCSTGQNHVVAVAKSGAPDPPTFTVIPVNLSSSEVEQAARIQSCLLQRGVRVVERPAVESYETRTATGRTRESHDIVASFPEARADILVISHHASGRIKVLNRLQGYQVVLSESYPTGDTAAACTIISYAMAGLGNSGAQ